MQNSKAGSLLYAVLPAVHYTVLTNVLYALIGEAYRLALGRALSPVILQGLSAGTGFLVFDRMLRRGGVSAECGDSLPKGSSVRRFAAYFCFAVSAVMFGRGVSNIIAMSGIMQRSAGYQHVAEHFYGNNIWIEILVLAVIGPAAEETVYRGLVYGGLRAAFSRRTAVIVSAVLFGVMHFNIVQGIYAAAMGVLFACIVDRTGSLAAAVGAHMAVNFVSVLGQETDWLDFLNVGGDGFYVSTAVCLLLGGIFWSYTGRLLSKKDDKKDYREERL